MKKQTGHYIYKLGNWKLALLLLLLFVFIGWAQETYPIGLSYLPKISPAATALDTSAYTAADVYRDFRPWARKHGCITSRC